MGGITKRYRKQNICRSAGLAVPGSGIDHTDKGISSLADSTILGAADLDSGH